MFNFYRYIYLFIIILFEKVKTARGKYRVTQLVLNMEYIKKNNNNTYKFLVMFR